MLKGEFEVAVERQVNEDQFEVINTVYMYYPGIDDKSTVYDMFLKFGFLIFDDLYPRAKRLAELNEKICKLNQEIKTLKGGRAVRV